MIKMFLIFALSINYIMQSKEIITAPITDAITSSDVVDRPSVCGAFNFTTMKLIHLTQGKTTQVDDWNYDWLNQWKWYALKISGNYYAVRNDKTINGKREVVKMHRLIMHAEEGILIDHRNRDGLDNQEHNLRNCTHSQNCMNRKSAGRSKYLGVSYQRRNNCERIISQIYINKKNVYLGSFKTEEAAAHAYDKAAKLYHGEFANLNFK